MSLVDEENQLDVDDDDSAAPPVVAVVVTHDPGPWFDECLASLGAQDYPALSVLVIDAASAEDPTERVASVLPDAYVRRLDGNPGFGAAANEVLSVVEGAAFYLLCHDDVALEPDAVRLLVQEAYRSNAGIVGPKLVMWHDTARLLQVGVQIDKAAHEVGNAERGELDQEQHDAVRDVFCVPGAATLVRADLFSTLGGFDPVITYIGEDVDLCWRAQVAGARVLIVPPALARHAEALGQREGFSPEARRRMALRHRLRAVLTNYSRLHRLRVVPQIAVLSFVELVYATAAGRRRLAADIVDSWRWNRSHRDDINAARERLAAIRSVPDSEVRRLQSRGSARFALFLRGQLGRGGDDRVKALTRSAGDLAGSLRRGPRRTAVAVWTVLVAVLVIGSRHHLTGSPLSLVDLPQLPNRPWDLLAEWLSGWRRAGLGNEGPQPTAFGLLGVGGTVLLGSTQLLRRVLVVLPLLVGPVGAARLVRRTGSPRAPWVAAITYAAVPLPYDALATGRWGGLVLWSATPWIVGSLAAVTGDEPFRVRAGEVEPARWRRIVGLGLLVAILAAAVPVAILLPLVLAAALAVGGLVVGRSASTGRVLLTAGGASLVAAGLHLPWTLDFLLPGSTWAAVAGARSSAASPDLLHVLRFETGPLGAAPIGFAFLVAGALPLLIGKSWRLRWAVRAWVLAIVGWGMALLDGASRLHVTLGPTEALLAPAACGLAMATALGMVAFEVDLPGYRFGWRQAASFAAAAAVATGAVPVVGGAIDGDWRTPHDGIGSVLGFLDTEQRTEGAFRTLWLGDPSVLPLAGWELDGDWGGVQPRSVAWALTDRGLPNAVDRWSGSPDGTTEVVADALQLAAGDETARLGRLLAPMGVRYVVVVEADRPIVGTQVGAPPRLLDALGEQLDLAEVGVDAGVHVYRNAAWFPARAVLPDPDLAGGGDGPLAAAARADVDAATAVLPSTDGADRYEGELEDGAAVWFSASDSSGWSLSAGGESRDRSVGFGFGNLFAAGPGGHATLRYSTPIYRLLLSGLQAAAWFLVIRALARAWRHDRVVAEEAG